MFVVNLGLTFLLISLSPLFGVYAFVGYLDAVAIFSGPVQLYALVAAGSLNALAQSGGPASALRQPVVFAFLLAANCGLAVAMVQIDKHRQRTVDRLRQIEAASEATTLDAARQASIGPTRRRGTVSPKPGARSVRSPHRGSTAPICPRPCRRWSPAGPKTRGARPLSGARALRSRPGTTPTSCGSPRKGWRTSRSTPGRRMSR